MILRPWRAADRAACHALFRDAVLRGAAEFYTADERAAWAGPERLPDHDRLAEQITIVAEADGRIEGFMSLREDGYLDMAFVAPERRGTGLAAWLLEAIVDEARGRGLTRLTTHASHPARRFFARHGWRLDAPERHAVRGQRLMRFAMSRDV